MSREKQATAVYHSRGLSLTFLDRPKGMNYLPGFHPLGMILQ
jgi:hypothetical protein